MTARDSAYAALGLRPGAARAEVDEAYRRLIKRHHPDRAGGDSTRAAEINRAYTFLRSEGLAYGPQARPMPVVQRHAERRRASRRSDWLFVAVLLAIVVAGFATMERGGHVSFFARPVQIHWPTIDTSIAPRGADPLLSFDEPLHQPVIDSAISQAMKFHSVSDTDGAAIYSRDCQNNLRRERNLAWFDACAAFDEATITLSSDAQLAKMPLFNTSAGIAREMAAAHVLSDDMLGADSRLQQIRSQVELQLLPRLDAAAGEKL
jgi:hypothetical protein